MKEQIRLFCLQSSHAVSGKPATAVLSLILAILTFPTVHPVFSNGIDPPLAWVFNFLIQGNLDLGRDIIFPHGPLAFLMYPLPMGANLIIAFILELTARTILAYCILSIRFDNRQVMRLFRILLVLFLLGSMDFLLVLVGLVLINYLAFITSRRKTWILSGILITVFAIYIKAFVGIVCLMITFSLVLILLLEILSEKRSPKILAYLLPLPALIIAVWVVMYRTVTGLPRYFFGMMELAGDNSTAVAYYPDNNWWLLGISGLLIIVIVLIQWNQILVRKYIILTAAPLFAVWKYGMAREDYLHAGMWFLFVSMVMLILLMLINRYRLVTLFSSMTIIGFLYLNLMNAFYFEPPSFSYQGTKAVYSMLFRYGTLTDTSDASSIRQIQRNRLDPAIRELIGSASTDVYPWDYSFIPANHFNWQPRPVLQSYASYTPWLDGENARHFSSSKAPEYLVWELRKITHDIHNGTLESIDGRYLLNDQPETVLALIENYRVVARQQGTFPSMILQKRDFPVRLKREKVGTDTLRWNSWTEVIHEKQDLIRLKAGIHRNLMGDLKSFLYKDEACYLYYWLENDEIRIYRIVPKNAAQGLWINPLILNPENSRSEPLVRKVMFCCTNPSLMQKSIPVQWEKVSLAEHSKNGPGTSSTHELVKSFFGKNDTIHPGNLLYAANDLEGNYPSWSENPSAVSGTIAYSGSTCCRVDSGAFSFSYELPLDSILSQSDDTALMIKADAWVNSMKAVDASLVISVEAENQPVLWKGVRINDFLIEKGTWNYVTNFLVLSRKQLGPKPLKLKVYAWNQGRREFLLDDMRVIITGL